MKGGPLTRWAERDPEVRYPLLLVALFVAWGLAGWIADPTELWR